MASGALPPWFPAVKIDLARWQKRHCQRLSITRVAPTNSSDSRNGLTRINFRQLRAGEEPVYDLGAEAQDLRRRGITGFQASDLLERTDRAATRQAQEPVELSNGVSRRDGTASLDARHSQVPAFPRQD
jgi:hypothetical protein